MVEAVLETMKLTGEATAIMNSKPAVCDAFVAFAGPASSIPHVQLNSAPVNKADHKLTIDAVSKWQT